MQKAPKPNNEDERIQAVRRLNILDTEPEERFNRLTMEAADRLKVPISMVSILDSDREWYKSCFGINQEEGDRDVSFCGHALLSSTVFIVDDTKMDDRFSDNPMVLNYPFIRFYAGVVLFDKKTNLPIGVFCVKDTKPRTFSPDQISILMELASKAEEELNKS